MLEVRDNGKGFDSQNIRAKGIGLKNIHDRVALFGGSIKLLSNSMRKGTLIRIFIPVDTNGMV